MLKLAPAKIIFAALIATNVCSASIVVFAFGKKTVIVAADSRETYGDGTFKDTACKIGSSGNDVVFTHVGISSFGVTDLMLEARSAVAAAIGGSQSIAQKAAMTWKDRAATILLSQGTEQLLRMATQNGSPQLAAFMFASTETATGTIAIWYTTVTLKIENGLLVLEARAEPYGVDGEDELKLRALGHEQIFWEYAHTQTDRAKLWRKEVEAVQVPIDRKLEETVARLVQLTIDNDPEGVGGSVDRLRLDVGKGIQWQSRKPECSSSGERVLPPDLKAAASPMW